MCHHKATIVATVRVDCCTEEGETGKENKQLEMNVYLNTAQLKTPIVNQEPLCIKQQQSLHSFLRKSLRLLI